MHIHIPTSIYTYAFIHKYAHMHRYICGLRDPWVMSFVILIAIGRQHCWARSFTDGSETLVIFSGALTKVHFVCITTAWLSSIRDQAWTNWPEHITRY